MDKGNKLLQSAAITDDKLASPLIAACHCAAKSLTLMSKIVGGQEGAVEALDHHHPQLPVACHVVRTPKGSVWAWTRAMAPPACAMREH